MTFSLQKTIFGFFMIACDKEDGDNFSYKNFGLGRPFFHVTDT